MDLTYFIYRQIVLTVPSIMHRLAWLPRVRKLRLAAGFVAAFGSVWFTSKDQFYLSSSYGSFLWNYFVPGFLKNNSGSLPEKQPRSPQSSRKLPHVQIRRNEKLVSVNMGVVSHYETNNLASNEPIEDRNSQYIMPNGILFGVFDGHSGWQCAEEVTKRLPYYVALSMAHAQELSSANVFHKLIDKVRSLEEGPDKNRVIDPYGMKAKGFHKVTESPPGRAVNVEQQLKNAYKLLDEDIVYEALPNVNGYAPEEMLKGLSGACAITAYIQDSDLYVANSGDCRTVLGSKGPDGKWHATSLSVDQNALNTEEVERLKLEHPGEDFVVFNDRLLGHLQPFRAFGDVVFKWDSRSHEEFLNKIYKRVVIPPQMYRTPPYLTAEPVVTSHTLQAGDKFLVIATDGLWDMISSDKAVECIGELLDSDSLAKRVGNSGTWKINGASQLIQEALGGDDEVKVTRLLDAPKQIRRALRDDITVTVVYFSHMN